MDTPHEQDLHATALECVSVADYEEVMGWMKNSDDVDPCHHIPNLPPTQAEVAPAAPSSKCDAKEGKR